MLLPSQGQRSFAGTWSGGVFLSTNNGTSWTEVNTGLTDTYIECLAISDTNLFVGTPYDGVFLSTNNGTSWININTGLPETSNVGALVVSGTNLFTGTLGSGVWKRPLTEMITSIAYSNSMPSRFNLEQNYPNPFNPSTTIVFSLPLRTFVSLKVFDALGREAATIISEELSAGTYSRQWKAKGFPSGVYFYRLQAGSFMETRKLIFVK